MSAAEAGTIEIRPDLAEYRALLRSRLPWGGALIALLALRVIDRPATGLIIVGVLALIAAAGIAHIATVRIRLTPGAIVHEGLVVPNRTIAIDDARGVYGVLTQSVGGDVLTLVVQSRRTRKSMRVFRGLWNVDQLDRIAEHMGIVRLGHPVNGNEMAAYVPGAMPLRYRRPLSFGLGVGLVIVVIPVAAVIVANT